MAYCFFSPSSHHQTVDFFPLVHVSLFFCQSTPVLSPCWPNRQGTGHPMGWAAWNRWHLWQWFRLSLSSVLFSCLLFSSLGGECNKNVIFWRCFSLMLYLFMVEDGLLYYRYLEEGNKACNKGVFGCLQVCKSDSETKGHGKLCHGLVTRWHSSQCLCVNRWWVS